MKPQKKESRKREPTPHRILPGINGTLVCSRGDVSWTVIDLNPERRVVKCPGCGTPNDIREAIKRGL